MDWERFYYKKIYANRKVIKETTECVAIISTLWLFFTFLSFHFFMAFGPLRLDQYCEREPRNGFTTLYYWAEYPARVSSCWLWRSKKPKKLNKKEADELMKILNPQQECDLFTKEAK